MTIETELKQDVGYTYTAELINTYGHAEVTATGCREIVETKIKEWIPLLMNGDTIRFTRIEKE
jgi:hypothetical protein